MALKLYMRKPDGSFEPIAFYGVPYNDAPLRTLIKGNTDKITAEESRATKAEKANADAIAELAGGGALRPLYEAMPNVKWNPVTKMYDVWKEQGGISVSEKEMSGIYNSSLGADSYEFFYVGSPKCIIPRFNLYALNKQLLIKVLQSTSAQFLAVSPSQNTGKSKAFSIITIFDSSRLKVIYNSIYCNKSCNYVGLGGIEMINLVIDKVSAFTINLRNAIKISYDSWRYIPDNVIGDTYSNTTTITVHSTPYSLLTGTATDEQYTATGHTKAEWMQIVTDSKAKGITFTQTLESFALYTQQTRFRRALSEPTHIEGNEIVAATNKALHRVGSDVYFDRATLLSGETVSDFVEIDREEALAIIRAKEAEEAAKYQPMEEATE